jgi:HlyD family secretion protein
MATSTSSLPEVTAVSPKRKPNPKVLLAIAGVVIAGFLGWKFLVPPAPATVLHVSGRIEADETDIGAKTGGRVAAILVREGDSVKAGQVVAEIVDEEVNAQLQGAIAQVNAAKQDAAQAKLEIEVATSRIQEAEAMVTQAQSDSRGRVNQSTSTVSASKAQVAQAQAQVAEAQAGIKQAEAQLKLARVDRDRYADLVAQGAINRQQFDQAQTNADTAQATLDTARAILTARFAAVKAAEEQLAASQGSLTQSQSTTLNPAIRSSQLSAYQQQKQQASAKLIAAEAKVKNAQAAQRQLQNRLDSFKVKSPIDGVVQSRPLEPGAIVATGKTLLTVLNPDAVYLRAYVPEGDIGKIYPGKPARVFLDSNLKQPLPATVSAIDSKASFTPENIYFQKDRVRQVFGIKLAIQQSQGYAKPGMPADAEIDIKP